MIALATTLEKITGSLQDRILGTIEVHASKITKTFKILTYKTSVHFNKTMFMKIIAIRYIEITRNNMQAKYS